MGLAEDTFRALRKESALARARLIRELRDVADLARCASDAIEISAKETVAEDKLKMERSAENLLDYARISMYRAEREWGAWKALRLRALHTALILKGKRSGPPPEARTRPQPKARQFWTWLKVKIRIRFNGKDQGPGKSW